MIRKSIVITFIAGLMAMFTSAQSVNEAGELFNQAIQEYQAENYATAATKFRQAADMAEQVGDDGIDLMIKAEQQWVISLYNEGKKHYSNKDYNEAVTAFSAAAEAARKVRDEKTLDASNTYIAGIKTAFGNNYLRDDDHDNALRYYDEAIEAKPGYIKAYYGKGLAYKKAGDLENMKAQLEQVLEMGEADEKTADRARGVLATTFLNEGAMALQNGDFSTAVQNLETSVKYNETEPQAFYYLALSYNGSGEYDKAIEAATAAVEKGFSQPGDAWFEVGKAHEAKGNSAAACEAYGKVTSGNNVEAAKYQREQVLKCG